MNNLVDKVKTALYVNDTGPGAGAANTGHGEHHPTTVGSDGTHDSGLTGTGLTGNSNNNHVPGAFTSTSTGTSSSTTAPHASNLANKVDPRVDTASDATHRGTPSTGLTGTSTSSTHGTHSTSATGSGPTAGGTHNTSTATGGIHGTSATGYDSTTAGTHAVPATGHGSSTVGPHSSDVANKADPRVDSDLDSTRHTTGGGVGSKVAGMAAAVTGSGQHATQGTPSHSAETPQTGHHDHHSHHGGLMGKVNDLLHGGAHHTKTANKLDPQLATGPVPLEHATVQDHGSRHGHSGTSGHVGGHGTTSGTTAGPHSSELANKADPRVDSDLDGKRGLGSGTATAGPHSSNVANKADPRVDSDLDGKRGLGNGTTSGTTTGPHSSNGANKADPRVDSDLDGRHGHVFNTGATGAAGSFPTGVSSRSGGKADYPDEPTGKSSAIGHKSSPTGTTSSATGPHKSSLLNKLDPRVDSDKDGSRLK